MIILKDLAHDLYWHLLLARSLGANKFVRLAISDQEREAALEADSTEPVATVHRKEVVAWYLFIADQAFIARHRVLIGCHLNVVVENLGIAQHAQGRAAKLEKLVPVLARLVVFVHEKGKRCLLALVGN